MTLVGLAATAVVVMSPAHALTQGFVWTTVVFYLLVDTMVGASALLTRSIVPGLIVHSAGLLTFFALIWPRDPTRDLVHVTGTDGWFWLHMAQVVVFSVLSVYAYRRVACARRSKVRLP